MALINSKFQSFIDVQFTAPYTLCPDNPLATVEITGRRRYETQVKELARRNFEFL